MQTKWSDPEQFEFAVDAWQPNAGGAGFFPASSEDISDETWGHIDPDASTFLGGQNEWGIPGTGLAEEGDPNSTIGDYVIPRQFDEWPPKNPVTATAGDLMTPYWLDPVSAYQDVVGLLSPAYQSAANQVALRGWPSRDMRIGDVQAAGLYFPTANMIVMPTEPGWASDDIARHELSHVFESGEYETTGTPLELEEDVNRALRDPSVPDDVREGIRVWYRYYTELGEPAHMFAALSGLGINRLPLYLRRWYAPMYGDAVR
jgi:hypothetical protein